MKRLVLALGALAAGCASVSPLATRQLEEARAAYRTVAADRLVQVYSQEELKLARAALDDAERMAKERAASEAVRHNAYLATQRARIARENAETRRVEAAIGELRAELSRPPRERRP
jgi:hypothetical protein